MRPLAVLIGIVMGSAVSLAVGLGLTWVTLQFLPEYADQLSQERAPLGQAIAAYGHIHQPFVREMGAFTVINAGSVSQSFDGNPRASNLLIENGAPKIRRVEYDIEKEIDAITASGLPHADWMVRTLRAARPTQMP